jgi:PAS domain S-box-containing protein
VGSTMFEQLSDLLGQAPDAVLCADDRGLVLWCNAGAEAMFGYGAGALRGSPMTVLLPDRYHARHRAWLERARVARLPEVQPESVEVHGRRADGVEFPVEFSVSWSRSTDPARFTAIIRDISERVARDRAARVGEERYRTLARNFPNGAVLLFDRDLRYQLADGLGLADVGLSKDILEGRTIWEAFPGHVERDRAVLPGGPAGR